MLPEIPFRVAFQGEGITAISSTEKCIAALIAYLLSLGLPLVLSDPEAFDHLLGIVQLPARFEIHLASGRPGTGNQHQAIPGALFPVPVNVRCVLLLSHQIAKKTLSPSVFQMLLPLLPVGKGRNVWNKRKSIEVCPTSSLHPPSKHRKEVLSRACPDTTSDLV
jgi:hypothetical protein